MTRLWSINDWIKVSEKTSAKWLSIQMDLDKYSVMSGNVRVYLDLYHVSLHNFGWIVVWTDEGGRGRGRGGWTMKLWRA